MFFSSFFNKIVFVGLFFSCAFVSGPSSLATEEDVVEFKEYFKRLLPEEVCFSGDQAMIEKQFAEHLDLFNRAGNYKDKMSYFLDSATHEYLVLKSKTLKKNCFLNKAQVQDLFLFLQPMYNGQKELFIQAVSFINYVDENERFGVEI